MCNPIHSLFGIEKVTKDFRGSDAAAKAWLRGGFCPKHNFFRLNYPYKRDRIAITVRPRNLRQNRRATGARMGLVSKHSLVDIMPNSYAMSRCGLRKLYFRYTSVDFFCYFTVNRTHFSAQLAYAR